LLGFLYAAGQVKGKVSLEFMKTTSRTSPPKLVSSILGSADLDDWQALPAVIFGRMLIRTRSRISEHHDMSE
jgi:hypothetical protein